MKTNRKKLLLLLLCLLFGCSAVTIQAGAKTKYKSEWVTSSKGYMYYYSKNGKKLTGMKKIGDQYYYFDSKGRQRTGWKKVGKNYYYFNIGTGTDGYRLSSTTVNGIKLKSTGKAKLTSAAKRKLAILVKANKKMQEITNPRMTKLEKLKAVFYYTKKHLKPLNRGGFKKQPVWDVVYAEYAFQTGRADCYSYASYFAYLANAIGYKAYVISSGTSYGNHGWAEINGKVYDPNWSNFCKVDTFFGMSYKLSGINGRYNYKKRYIREI